MHFYSVKVTPFPRLKFRLFYTRICFSNLSNNYIMSDSIISVKLGCSFLEHFTITTTSYLFCYRQYL